MRPARFSTGIAAAIFIARSALLGQDAQDHQRDVTDIDLDDLMKVTVTTPSKKEQPPTDVPVAV
jgi:hypothetical protein